MTTIHTHQLIFVTLPVSLALFGAISCIEKPSAPEHDLHSEDRHVEVMAVEEPEPELLHNTPQPVRLVSADVLAKQEAERKRRLAAEVQNRTILGQIGARSADESSGSLVDVLGDGAGRKLKERAFNGSTGIASGVLGAEKNGLASARSAAAEDSIATVTGARLDDAAEEYENHGINAMTRTSEDRFSTFSIDVDTGSYTIARRKLKGGILPRASSVRVEEFVNYFDYGYEAPERGAFSVLFEGAPSPFSTHAKRKLVRVGVQGKRVAQKDRKPVHLVFLVDVSGSMNSSDKLGLAKESLKVLTNNLSKEDTVALVTYAGSTREVLAPTSASKRGDIMEAIDNLRSGGGTAMNSGMEAAYRLAMQEVKPGHVSRVIVLSDGDANIGPSSFDEILESIASYVDEGVTLSTIGFGMGNYKDSMMEQLANKGNGNYYYIDGIDEARKVFGEQIGGTLEVIAKDVKIQVEFNPEIVESYRLVGYENRDIADKDFRNDRVDAGEIGAGHSVTALYEIELRESGTITGKSELAAVRMRHKQPQGHEATEQVYSLRRAAIVDDMNAASASFKFTVAVAGFAEILRGSPYVRHLGFDQIISLASTTEAPPAHQAEFITLVERASSLQ